MPNWVFNKVSITGDEHLIDSIFNNVQKDDSVISFWNIKQPTGEEFQKYQDSLGTPGVMPFWYDWNCENWGTKWDASNAELLRRDIGVVEYRFDTAWSPPLPVLTHLSEQYPGVEVVLDWEEEQGFGGQFRFSNGEANEESWYDIPYSHAEMVERGKVDECLCAWADDPSDFYNDCPGFAPENENEDFPSDELEIEVVS